MPSHAPAARRSCCDPASARSERRRKRRRKQPGCAGHDDDRLHRKRPTSAAPSPASRSTRGTTSCSATHAARTRSPTSSAGSARRRRAATAEDAAAAADIVVVTVPLKRLPGRPGGTARGQGRDRHQQLLPAAGRPLRGARRGDLTASGCSRGTWATSHVVKAFNHITSPTSRRRGGPPAPPDGGRWRSPVTTPTRRRGRRPDRHLGCDVVDVGPLAEGWRYQRHRIVVRLDADELRAKLGEARRYAETAWSGIVAAPGRTGARLRAATLAQASGTVLRRPRRPPRVRPRGRTSPICCRLGAPSHGMNVSMPSSSTPSAVSSSPPQRSADAVGPPGSRRRWSRR